MSARTLKISVIGCGYWGKNLVRVFSELGVLESVCDMDVSRRDFIKKEYPNVKTTSDYEAVLHSASIGGVAIATPASTHYELAKKA